MKISSGLVAGVERLRRVIQEQRYSRYQAELDRYLTLTQAAETYPDPNSLYSYMHHYYFHLCPPVLKEHRDFFKKERRGFGEDAFHAMWWLLLSEFRPMRMLEIGIYRGQTISLWALICKYLGCPCDIHGVSPFSSVGDDVSSYPAEFDYLADVLGTFRHWALDPPKFTKALSTDPDSIAHIQRYKWDLIYVDGSHDFEIALSDYKLCKANLKRDGILVLDDASVGTSFKPPRFSFAGHPGPSRIAREYADKEMRLLGIIGHNNVFQKI